MGVLLRMGGKLFISPHPSLLPSKDSSHFSPFRDCCAQALIFPENFSRSI